MKRGFTIIEILVVIGIIAVLTVIIFPSINNIRAKNRDAERVADLASIQLGLSMYYNQHSAYPANLNILTNSSPTKYLTTDSITPPNSYDTYHYVPLTRYPNTRCTYYHLGTKLELPSAQIDTADTFNSVGLTQIVGSYYYCGDDQSGIAPGNTPDNYHYNVHP